MCGNDEVPDDDGVIDEDPLGNDDGDWMYDDNHDNAVRGPEMFLEGDEDVGVGGVDDNVDVEDAGLDSELEVGALESGLQAGVLESELEVGAWIMGWERAMILSYLGVRQPASQPAMGGGGEGGGFPKPPSHPAAARCGSNQDTKVLNQLGRVQHALART